MNYTELTSSELVAVTRVLVNYECAYSVTPNDWSGWDVRIDLIDDEREGDLIHQLEAITSKF